MAGVLVRLCRLIRYSKQVPPATTTASETEDLESVANMEKELSLLFVHSADSTASAHTQLLWNADRK